MARAFKNRHACDIYKVAEQCGVILRDSADHSSTGRRPRECYCKPAAMIIGRRHGEAHLALCFRLLVETGHEGEIYADTLYAMSRVIASGLVEIDGALLKAFDAIDIGVLRAWAGVAKGKGTRADFMATVLLWRLAGPDRFLGTPTAAEQAEYDRRQEREVEFKRRRDRKRRLAMGSMFIGFE